MKKIVLAILSIALGSSVCYAQESTAETAPKEKKLEHHIGVQMNELIRQVFNFNNSTASNLNNPYLIVYSVNLAKTGWGLRLGAGYTRNTFSDDDGVTKRETDINDLNLRLGVEKAFKLSDKWTAGAGLDGLYSNDNDYTNSVIRSFDTTTTKTNSKVTRYGGGAMAWLRYAISPRVVIGTETSFYYQVGNQQQTINIMKRNNSLPSRPMVITTSTIDGDVTEGIFRLPVVFYLMVRF